MIANAQFKHLLLLLVWHGLKAPLLGSHFKKATLLDCNVNLKPADFGGSQFLRLTGKMLNGFNQSSTQIISTKKLTALIIQGFFYFLITPLLTLKLQVSTLVKDALEKTGGFFYVILHPTKYITLVSAVILQFGKVNKKNNINLWHDSTFQGESTCVISLSLMLLTPNDA